MGLIKGIIKFLFGFIIGMITGKKQKQEIVVDLSAYRTDEQDRALHYFSEKNKKGCIGTIKGCFKKKPAPKVAKVKKKGCFPKKLGFMSDADYDALVASVMKRLDLKNKGLTKLALDESQVEKTIQFGNYLWYNDEGEFASGAKLGEDGKWRSTTYESTFIFFTRNQIAAYQITFHLDWEKHEEDTFEYHYKDITALQTSTKHEDKIDLDIGDTVFKCYKNELYIKVPNDSFKINLGNKPTAEEESAIQGMKSLLREKKA
ncbi:MAG: hypothetical protein FWD22_03920 [Treponema sp.]|nr:hypothetical protein [Treponema sp.]